jgi:thiol-disulfide isomerase/thioredoxin
MTSPAPPPVAEPRRRRLFMGAGAAALVAGAGIAWWSQRSGAGGDPALDALWALKCERPDGSPLALADFRGRPLLVNFWATWCPPCVEELPMIDGFFAQRAANGMQVLGLAVDKAASVRTFLARTPVKFPVGITGMDGLALLRTLGNKGGGLPFSMVLSAAGDVHARKMGQISLQELQGWAREV